MLKKIDNQVKNALVRGLRVSRRRTRQAVVLAMIGVTGSGLSAVARELSRMLHWNVIEKNKIRVRLREKGSGFTPASTDEIHYAMLKRALNEKGNAVLDSDFAEKPKRKKLERFAKRFQAKVVYLHVVCDGDVMIERVLKANYNPRTDIFASAAVAVREHCRRYPWHYRWSPGRGGQYFLRKPPVKVLAALNTTGPEKWKKRLEAVVKRLRRM